MEEKEFVVTGKGLILGEILNMQTTIRIFGAINVILQLLTIIILIKTLKA